MQTYYAMNAGASAVLISNNQSSGFFRMSQTGYSGAITVPTGTLPQNAARAMYNALVAGNQLTVAFSNYTLPTRMAQHDHCCSLCACAIAGVNHQCRTFDPACVGLLSGSNALPGTLILTCVCMRSH